MFRCFLLCFIAGLPLAAQWRPVVSPTKADLLSIDSRDHALWVSGAHGVVLRNADGETWQSCALPAGKSDVALTSISPSMLLQHS